MSIYGVLATALALALLVFNGGTVMRPVSPSLLLILVLCALGGALIIVLCRVQIPKALRAALIPAIILSLMLVTLHGDVFLTKHVSRALEQAGTDAPETTTKLDDRSAGPTDRNRDRDRNTSGQGGASVQLEPGAAGDSGWALKLTDALDRRFGGKDASAILVQGTVGAHPSREATLLVVNWRIAVEGVSATCGTSSVAGTDPAALIDQVGQPIAAAVARSASQHRALCP